MTKLHLRILITFLIIVFAQAIPGKVNADYSRSVVHPVAFEYEKYRAYPAYVLRVIDGDTIVVNINLGFGLMFKETIRFLDYDSPETFRPTCEEERALGKEATKWLKQQIHDEDIILYVPKKERGKYGRVLAIVYYDETNMQEEMIKRGYIKKEAWK